MENKRQIGSIYEKKAAEYLTKCGYRILTMNYRCRIGEIDIVARDGKYLVFVEVKYRAAEKGGFPQEAVDYKKQRKICKVADYYCMTHGSYGNTSCRFDVVAILDKELTLIKDAFEYIG